MSKPISDLLMNDIASINLAGKAQQSKMHMARVMASPFVVTTVLIMTIIGTVGTAMIFPGLPVWLLVLLSAAGLVVDALFYTDDTLKSFGMIFGTGLFTDLENFVIKRQLNKKLDAQLDKVITAWATKNNIDGELLKLLKESEKNKKKIADYCLKNNILQNAIESQFKKINKKYHASSKLSDNMISAWRTERYPFLIQQKIKAKGKNLTRKQIHDLVMNDCKNSDSLLDRFGAEVGGILQEQRSELITKKILIVSGVVIALLSGFGWASMAYIHLLPLLALMTVPIAAMPVIAGVISAMMGVSWCMMMYKMISDAIKKNIFRQLWEKLDMTRKPVNGKLPPLGWHIAKWALKIIPVALIIAVGIITTFLSAGALLDASVQVIILILAHPSKVAVMVVQTLMYGIVLPFTILFSIKHSVGAFHKLVDIAKKTWATLGSPSEIIQSIKERPIRSIFYAVGFVIAGAALFIHLIAEAASTAGEGAAILSGWAGKFFKWMSSLIRVKPTTLAIGSGALIEGLEHGDYVLDYTKKRVDCIFDFISPGTPVKKAAPVSVSAAYTFFQKALPKAAPAQIILVNVEEAEDLDINQANCFANPQ